MGPVVGPLKGDIGRGGDPVRAAVEDVQSAVFTVALARSHRRDNDHIIHAVVIEIAQCHGPLCRVFQACVEHSVGRGVDAAGVLARQRPNEVDGKGGAALLCRGNLFNVGTIQVHADGVNGGHVAGKDTSVMVLAVHTQEDHFSTTWHRVEDVGHAVVVHLQFEIVTDRPGIQHGREPIGPGEVDLMKDALVVAHQAPLHAIGMDA